MAIAITSSCSHLLFGSILPLVELSGNLAVLRGERRLLEELENTPD